MSESSRPLRVLALEPYYGGSHREFLDQWVAHSQHQWTLHTLPPYKWRWRMRHSALHFAEHIDAGSEWDIIFCSDMLNLSEFLSLCPTSVRDLPRVVYFHENQLTYPVPEGHRRDYHTAFMNFTSALCSTETWFNSNFHRTEFLTGMRTWMKRMPDHPPLEALNTVQDKSRVMYPGIRMGSTDEAREKVPHLLWIGRHEYDKNISLLRDALQLLPSDRPDFKLSIIGGQFPDEPSPFQDIHQQFASNILHWGYLESRADYEQVLSSADYIVSTAIHEFFGIAVMEAAATGAIPILPDRLAYPELFDHAQHPQFFYKGTAQSLSQRLMSSITSSPSSTLSATAKEIAQAHLWQNRIAEFDNALYKLSL